MTRDPTPVLSAEEKLLNNPQSWTNLSPAKIVDLAVKVSEKYTKDRYEDRYGDYYSINQINLLAKFLTSGDFLKYFKESSKEAQQACIDEIKLFKRPLEEVIVFSLRDSNFVGTLIEADQIEGLFLLRSSHDSDMKYIDQAWSKFLAGNPDLKHRLGKGEVAGLIAFRKAINKKFSREDIYGNLENFLFDFHQIDWDLGRSLRSTDLLEYVVEKDQIPALITLVSDIDIECSQLLESYSFVKQLVANGYTDELITLKEKHREIRKIENIWATGCQDPDFLLFVAKKSSAEELVTMVSGITDEALRSKVLQNADFLRYSAVNTDQTLKLITLKNGIQDKAHRKAVDHAWLTHLQDSEFRANMSDEALAAMANSVSFGSKASHSLKGMLGKRTEVTRLTLPNMALQKDASLVVTPPTETPREKKERLQKAIEVACNDARKQIECQVRYGLPISDKAPKDLSGAVREAVLTTQIEAATKAASADVAKRYDAYERFGIKIPTKLVTFHDGKPKKFGSGSEK